MSRAGEEFDAQNDASYKRAIATYRQSLKAQLHVVYDRFKYPGAARERIEVLIKRELGATITKVPPHDLAKLEALIAIFDKRARRYESMRKWPKNERTKEELADIMVLFGKNADLNVMPRFNRAPKPIEQAAAIPSGPKHSTVGLVEMAEFQAARRAASAKSQPEPAPPPLATVLDLRARLPARDKQLTMERTGQAKEAIAFLEMAGLRCTDEDVIGVMNCFARAGTTAARNFYRKGRDESSSSGGLTPEEIKEWARFLDDREAMQSRERAQNALLERIPPAGSTRSWGDGEIPA